MKTLKNNKPANKTSNNNWITNFITLTHHSLTIFYQKLYQILKQIQIVVLIQALNQIQIHFFLTVIPKVEINQVQGLQIFIIRFHLF